MNEVIAWVTFLGAWLLVIGPLYQGSVELNEMDLDREGLEGIRSSAADLEGRPSAWWWLLPPVMYILRRRWSKTFWAHTFAHLPPAQVEQLTSFRAKTTGWFTVAGGATLLAVGETWRLVRHYGWPQWVFWLLLAALLAVALVNTTARMHDHQRRQSQESEYQEEAQA